MSYNKSYNRGFNSYEESYTGPEVQQKLDMGDLVKIQVLRCEIAESGGDETKHANGVEGLLHLLPRENRERLESDKYRSLYVTKVETFEYRYSCGHKMGSPERPVFRNNPLDWNYHGGPPELVSPIAVEVEQTDYQKLFNLIMSEFEDLGVTWKKESMEEDI
jgi:hypothetical protein